MGESQTVVVTGASRGIGLSFCQQCLERGMKVYAICRTPTDALKALDVEVIDQCDVANEAAIKVLQARLEGINVDLLINNAGILRNEMLGDIDYDSIRAQFEVNTLGPLRVTEALLPNLSSGSKVALITSRMGSIADNTSGGRYGYRMSKVALNIAGVSLACDLQQKEIAVGIYHPGLVGTDMIGGHGDITPDEAAQRLLQRIDELTLENSGVFRHSNGETLPW